MNRMICISLIGLFFLFSFQGGYSMSEIDNAMTFNELSNFNVCIDIDDEIERILGDEKQTWFNPLWTPPIWFRKVMSYSVIIVSLMIIGHFFYKGMKR